MEGDYEGVVVVGYSLIMVIFEVVVVVSAGKKENMTNGLSRMEKGDGNSGGFVFHFLL